MKNKETLRLTIEYMIKKQDYSAMIPTIDLKLSPSTVNTVNKSSFCFQIISESK